MANGFTPMAANLNMNRNKGINVRKPDAGSEAGAKGYVDRSLNTLENLRRLMNLRVRLAIAICI
jgi:hypothetical protein